MSNARATRLTRRGILAAGGALGLGAVLTARGDDKGKSSGSGGGTTAVKSGPWSFKDDRGKAPEADKTPSSIVAFVGVAAALHDYGIDVKGVFGPNTIARLKDHQILRPCRRRGHAINHAVAGIAALHNLKFAIR
jgi:iron complex transport system substrate-binding protein